MQTIDLAPVQNQTLTTTLDGDFYNIGIYLAAGIMACDISKNNVVLQTGMRVLAGEFVIPFFCYQGIGGNFMMLTNNEELPDYTQFGITQTLIYMTAQEIAALVGGTAP